MQGDNAISWLMFFTLASGVFIIAGAFIYFLRSRTNRQIAANALEGDSRSKGVVPSGAAPLESRPIDPPHPHGALGLVGAPRAT